MVEPKELLADKIESLANEFAELVITRFSKIFLEKEKIFLDFIDKHIAHENDQVFLRKLLKTEFPGNVEVKLVIPYEILLEIVEQTFIWKYRWAHIPFEFKYPQEDTKHSRRNILHHSAMLGAKFPEIAEILKKVGEFGQALFESDPDGKKPLYYAIKNRSVDIVAYCIENYSGELCYQPLDDGGLTGIEYAINKDDPAIIEALKPKQQTWSQFLNQSFRQKPLLHLAIEKSAIKFIKYLAQEEMDWSLIDPDSGNSSLHVAVISRNLTMVQFILSRSKDLIRLSNKRGFTPVTLAISKINVNTTGQLADIIKYLLSQGAKLTYVDKDNLAKLINRQTFIGLDAPLKGVLKYVRWEERYRIIAALTCIFSGLAVVSGVILLLIGFETPLVESGVTISGLLSLLSGYAFFARFSRFFPILEQLEQLPETIARRLHRNTSYTFSPEEQVKPEIGYGNGDIEKGLLEGESKHKPEEKIGEEIGVEYQKFLEEQDEKSKELAKDLYSFVDTLSDNLEKMRGAPRLGIVDSLRRKLKDSNKSLQVKEELRQRLNMLITLPIPKDVQEFLQSERAKLERLNGARGLIVGTDDVKKDLASDSETDDSDSKNEGIGYFVP